MRRGGREGREIGGGFKLFYSGRTNKRNGIGVIISVGIITKKDWLENILEVKRTSDRIMTVKLVFAGGKINIVSAYAPQVRCAREEKKQFWEEMEEVVREIPSI